MRAKNRNISITEALDKDLPRIWADERAVRQVTLNLLSNAIKFTPQGGAITIKVGWTSSGGQYLSIRDTGPGIAEEEIPIVLASFGRGSLSTRWPINFLIGATLPRSWRLLAAFFQLGHR
jgi:two-component system cell cycle sensor histidine kinase PleC